MEEKQVEVKQEAMPAQEPKRPLLLFVVLILNVFLFAFMRILFCYMFISTPPDPLLQPVIPLYMVIIVLNIIPVVFVAVISISLWQGKRWSEIGMVIWGIIFITMALFGFFYNYKERFAYYYNWMEAIRDMVALMYILLIISIIFYILFNKNIKAYRRK